MGSNVSNQMIESTTAIVSKAMTEISTTVNSGTSSYTTATQEMPIYIKGLTMINSSGTFTQSADLTVSTMLESSADLSNDLANKLKATLKETMVNDLTQANEGLNLGQLNISNARQSTSTYIENNLENIINSTINNVVTQYINGRQVMPVTLLDVTMKGSSIVFNQEMQIKAIAKNVSTSIVKNVIKNALTADVAKDLTNKTEQLNKGLDMFGIFGLIAVVIVGRIGYKAVQGKTHEMKMQKFRSGRGSKRRGNIIGPSGAQGPSRKPGFMERIGLRKPGIDPRLKDRKTEKLAKEISSTKKWYAIGGVIALILLFAVWYCGKQWVSVKYDISYLGDLEPEGGRSGFYAPSMVYSRPQYKYG